MAEDCSRRTEYAERREAGSVGRACGFSATKFKLAFRQGFVMGTPSPGFCIVLKEKELPECP